MKSNAVIEKLFQMQHPQTGETEGVDARDLFHTFEQFGVVIMERFFTDEELAEVRGEMATFYRPYLDAFQARAHADIHKGAAFHTDIIPWDPIEQGVESFKNLANHAKLKKVTDILLGKGFTAPGSLVMYSVPGGRGQAWHQDCPAEATGAFNLNRLIYTEDVAEEDGGIVFVPRSQEYGNIPEGGHQDPIAGEVAMNPARGTVIFLHGHVYHRVKPNQGQKPRVSVNFRAFPDGVDPQVNCIGVYRNGRVNFCDKPKQHDGTPTEMPVMTARE